MIPGLELATASYGTFQPGWGVPVGTSVGRHPEFKHAPECNALKPWGVFKKMEHLPLDEQEAAYIASLNKRQGRIWAELAEIHMCYPEATLVLLCWCSPDTALTGGCHRRWAAEWFETEHGIVVPESVPEGSVRRSGENGGHVNA